MEASTSTSVMVSDISADPVSSLRAAALSTLKSKRRKIPVERPAAIPARPPPPSDSFHLDYGQDENPQDISMRDIPGPSAPSIPPGVTKPVGNVSTSLDQDLSREEGEISEEDEPPPMKPPSPPVRKEPTPPPLVSSPEPVSPTAGPLAASLSNHRPALPRAATPENRPPTLLARISSPSRVAQPIALPALDTQMLDTVWVEPRSGQLSLGPESVRPGLNLTQSEYDTIKDIVLDLLGWGVPPTYFVECGLSREAIFYVFYELNLALPEGFDASGLQPYTPDTLAESLMPPPRLPESRSVDLGSHLIEPPASPPVQASVLSVPPVDSPNTNLHDIEKQRRQELMARKAAQASRKLRQSASIDSNGSTTFPVQLKDALITPTATEVVDDFLKSIEPVSLEPTNTAIAATTIDRIEDEDNIYNADPAFNGRRSSISDYASSRSPEPEPATADEPDSDSHPNDIPSTLQAVNEPASTFGSLSSLPQTTDETAYPSTVVTMSTPDTTTTTLRRGVKRAVATDFDFDSGPGRHGFGHPPPAKQPKTAFVNIVSHRCVIDLSDSEGEEEEDRYVPEPQPWQKRDRRSKASTAPVKPATPNGISSPSALLQKEQEIRMMRELIARREEETRLKKLALAKTVDASAPTSATPSKSVSPPPPLAQPQPLRLKTEDADVLMSTLTPVDPSEDTDALRAEIIARRSSESASPPAEISEASLPVTRSVTKSPIVKSDVPSGIPGKSNPYLPAGRLPPNSLLHLTLSALYPSSLDTQLQIGIATNSPDFITYASCSAVVQTCTCSIILLDSIISKLDAPQQEQRQVSMFSMVDVDMFPSSSAETSKSLTTTSAHPKQDVRKSPLLEVSPQPQPHNDQYEHPEVPGFTNYHSPFESYPLLRVHNPTSRDLFSPSMYSPSMYSHSPFSSSIPAASSTTSPSSSSPLYSLIPDLQPLRLAALSKRLDPSKRLCQYEVPGGGTCRDDKCDDLHLSRLDGAAQDRVVEPSDQETADYLFSFLPGVWISKYGVQSPSRIFEALQQVQHRLANNPPGLEDKILNALALIGISSPT